MRMASAAEILPRIQVFEHATTFFIGNFGRLFLAGFETQRLDYLVQAVADGRIGKIKLSSITVDFALAAHQR